MQNTCQTIDARSQFGGKSLIRKQKEFECAFAAINRKPIGSSLEMIFCMESDLSNL
jgi:hypothetical protein